MTEPGRGLPVNEPLEVRLQEPPGSLEALARDDPRAIAARWPACLAAWAGLGEEALGRRRPVEAYAFFRVGYHRGLDRLRGSGWRGAGTVPWAHEPNRGFLRSLRGLGEAAAALGEADEARRCADFFLQLAPDAPRSR
ncbi:MAG TPA: DUF3151 family protein [Actinomycetota bacterium]|nr:DUF3151 family protein [Actinomycetota bacterium]